MATGDVQEHVVALRASGEIRLGVVDHPVRAKRAGGIYVARAAGRRHFGARRQLRE